MLAELRVIELELQTEVAGRDIAVGLHPAYTATLEAVALYRRRYEEYLQALAILFWRGKG